MNNNLQKLSSGDISDTLEFERIKFRSKFCSKLFSHTINLVKIAPGVYLIIEIVFFLLSSLFIVDLEYYILS